MSVIRKSEGIPNKDLDRFARDIQSLCDKWDRDDIWYTEQFYMQYKKGRGFYTSPNACFNALESWSGQEVGLKPQRIPSSLLIASLASIPSMSLATPCVFPEQPPWNFTSWTFPASSISNEMALEQTPDVLYTIVKSSFEFNIYGRIPCRINIITESKKSFHIIWSFVIMKKQ